jgi:hypothetical protein
MMSAGGLWPRAAAVAGAREPHVESWSRLSGWTPEG